MAKIDNMHYTREKNTFQWSKVVSEAIFPTNQGYVSIAKWPWIFVSGTGSARTGSEEKAILVRTPVVLMIDKNFAK